MRFLVKRLLCRAVSVDKYRNVHGPSSIPAPIGMRSGRLRRGFVPRPSGSILLRLPDCLENAAHVVLFAGWAGWDGPNPNANNISRSAPLEASSSRETSELVNTIRIELTRHLAGNYSAAKRHIRCGQGGAHHRGRVANRISVLWLGKASRKRPAYPRPRCFRSRKNRNSHRTMKYAIACR